MVEASLKTKTILPDSSYTLYLYASYMLGPWKILRDAERLRDQGFTEKEKVGVVKVSR